MIRINTLPIIIITCFIFILGVPEKIKAQEASLKPPADTCSGIARVFDFGRISPLLDNSSISAPPKAEILPVLSLSDKNSHTFIVIITGPTLGSMDDDDIKTTLECSAGHMSLTAQINRSADFTGAALKNILWKPVFELKITTNRPVKFNGKWVMRTTDGRDVTSDLNDTAQKFPIYVEKDIALDTQ